tara:strand:- start:869 stop:1444 length:576 start_codon:yes stop_codon:yes gene_type:complete
VKKVEIISAILGDAALPLVGFLFWDWGFYFIVLFFLFDLGIRILFLRKKTALLPSIILPKGFFLKGIGLVILEIALLHLLVYFSFKSISFIAEFWAFLSYEELGIAQGVLLLPLLFLNEIIRIRNEKKIGVPQNVRFEILKNSQLAGLFRILFWSILLLVTVLFSISETTLVSILILTLCIQPFWIYRNIS